MIVIPANAGRESSPGSVLNRFLIVVGCVERSETHRLHRTKEPTSVKRKGDRRSPLQTVAVFVVRSALLLGDEAVG
jgi:hypothetical protein